MSMNFWNSAHQKLTSWKFHKFLQYQMSEQKLLSSQVKAQTRKICCVISRHKFNVRLIITSSVSPSFSLSPFPSLSISLSLYLSLSFLLSSSLSISLSFSLSPPILLSLSHFFSFSLVFDFCQSFHIWPNFWPVRLVLVTFLDRC